MASPKAFLSRNGVDSQLSTLTQRPDDLKSRLRESALHCGRFCPSNGECGSNPHERKTPSPMDLVCLVKALTISPHNAHVGSGQARARGRVHYTCRRRPSGLPVGGPLGRYSANWFSMRMLPKLAAAIGNRRGTLQFSRNVTWSVLAGKGGWEPGSPSGRRHCARSSRLEANGYILSTDGWPKN
jgi:hypothetical protein